MKKQEYKVNSDSLLKKVKELIKEGNTTKIIIKNEKGANLIEFPVTIGAIGAILSPLLVAVGAIAALATSCTIVVEKEGDKKVKK